MRVREINSDKVSLYHKKVSYILLPIFNFHKENKKKLHDFPSTLHISSK